MEVTKFAQKIAQKEKGKVQVNIAQISEILKVANELTKGLIYAVIRWLK